MKCFWITVEGRDRVSAQDGRRLDRRTGNTTSPCGPSRQNRPGAGVR